MLTKADIESKLKDNPDWEPNSKASDEEWDLYYEVLDAMEVEDVDEDDDTDWEDDSEDWEDAEETDWEE